MQSLPVPPRIQSAATGLEVNDMIRRSIVSRFAAVAVVLTPALAFAAGSAHDHAAGRSTNQAASCDCNHGQQSPTGASASTSSPASTTTSAEDLAKIWTGP